MKELVEFIAKKLVEKPDEVDVQIVDRGEEQDYELRVCQSDMGRIIGRSGRTAKAIRTIVNSAAIKKNVRANLEIVE